MGTGETQQQTSLVEVEGGASVAIATHSAGVAGGTEEVISLKTEQLTASQQAVVGAMEAAGVVSQRKGEVLGEQ